MIQPPNQALNQRGNSFTFTFTSKATKTDLIMPDTIEERRRAIEEAARKEKKAAKKAAKEAAAATAVPAITAGPTAPVVAPLPSVDASASAHIVPKTPITFLFPGQGSQALGMLDVRSYTTSNPTYLTCPYWYPGSRACS